MPTMLRSLSLMPRLPRFTRLGRPSTLLAASAFRVEVQPPSLRCAPMGSLWQRLVFWLMAPAPQHSTPPVNRLPLVRAEFLAALGDLAGDGVAALRGRIHQAHSLRELWHLRSDVYSAVGLGHSQALAEERVSQLNRHFPTRAPRSQFAPL